MPSFYVWQSKLDRPVSTSIAVTLYVITACNQRQQQKCAGLAAVVVTGTLIGYVCCPSITLEHTTKASGWNEMAIGRYTPWAPCNTVCN